MNTDISTLPLTALIERAQQLSESGQLRHAADLYRHWLAAGPQPQAYAAHFNLGILLTGFGDLGEAEQAFRQAVSLQPTLVQGWLALGNLLERTGRPEEALNCLSLIPGLTEDVALCVSAFNQMGVLLRTLARVPQACAMYRRSLSREPAQPEILLELLRLQTAEAGLANPQRRPSAPPGNAQQPLVSILIPTHNRPDYAELALLSALSQTYANIEIIISDNSDDDLTYHRFAPYVAEHSCIRYFRAPGLPFLGNFANCYERAQGEFVNFLMDDDLFHPEKIERMLVHFENPKVGLVTSFRQLIDGEGRAILHTGPSTARLVSTASLITGPAMIRHVLLSGLNVIGEPTTVLCRKHLLGDAFGLYLGTQYRVVSDMAAWLGILRDHDCVYLPEPLSYFRIHGEQGQLNPLTQARGAIENLRLLSDSCHFAFGPLAADDWKSLLATRLARFVEQLPQFMPVLVEAGERSAQVKELVDDVLGLLTGPARD